jgi:2-polyprenyl-6-methoxyphenol hydroxylase-like FAD-dependent oxidoreductase
MSGLLAARALADSFDRVTLVERDALPATPEPRKGVPQGAHAHGILPSGYRILDDYFPGMMDALEAAGAPRGDMGNDLLWFQYGRWKLRHRSGLRGITITRPAFEAAVRARVAALPNVTVLTQTTCLNPVFNYRSGRVTGVLVRAADRAVSMHDADLVIDATGRGSQTPAWLREWGFSEPRTVTVKVEVGYASRLLERRPGEFDNAMGGIIAGAPPAETRMGAVLAVEGNRWLVTLVGTLGDHPPSDDAGWKTFAATLPQPLVHELVTSARPVSDITTYRFPANQRRLYERMQRFPENYLVIGDAICSFNPVYGQGMSVAAMEALALVKAAEPGLDGIARRFFRRARAIVDTPWMIATGEDLRYPQVEGVRPRGSGAINRYFDRVHAAASRDEVVCRKFFHVLSLLAPPSSLFAPQVAWRVVARGY